MKKIIYLALTTILIFASCRNMSVTNTNFSPKMNVDPKAEEKKQKVEELEKNIAIKKDKYANYYYSNRDSFIKERGYTFYITPYVVEEFGLVNRLSLRIFVKVVSEEENVFDKVTFYDEKGNKISINFSNINRKYSDDTGFIEESSHGVIDVKDIKVFEKIIDSKDLYVLLEKKEKYVIKLPYPVRNSILDVIRKYKLLEETY